MIIFGTRGVTYKHNDGEFHCPSCGRMPFKHKRVRRFFTLYFIPVIPLDLLGEYVECGSCRDTYKPAVLQHDPSAGEAVEAEFHDAIKKVMVLMMLADGKIDDSEVDVIREIYSKLSGSEMTDGAVRAAAMDAERQGSLTAKDYLGPLVGSLNDQGKELVVRAAFMVAVSDGEFPEEERELLGEVAEALEMSGAHFKGVLATMMEDAPEA